MYGQPVPFLLVADLLETFSNDCERVEEKATRSLFCNLVRHFLEKMNLMRAFLMRRFGQWFGRISST